LDTIAGHDREALRRRMLPDGFVVGTREPDGPNVVAIGKYICEGGHEPVRMVLVE